MAVINVTQDLDQMFLLSKVSVDWGFRYGRAKHCTQIKTGFRKKKTAKSAAG